MGNDGSVSPFAYGYKSASGVGCISVTPFTTLTGGDHSISSIVTAGNSLIVGLESALSAIDKRTVALHVCDQAYAFKSGSDSGSTYTFTSPSQNWSGHAERMVYLSQDTVVPTFVEARINGTSLVMTFSEDLGAAASLANGAFTVKNGMGTTQTLGGTTSISDSTVTLTLATAVANTDTGVKVSYTKPMTGTANKVVDKFGNEVATFGDQDVNNALADSTPPEPAATDAAVLAADGLTLTLTFNEALKASSGAGDFDVHGGGDARGGQRGGGGAGLHRRRHGEQHHGRAEAGQADSAQRRLGESELREAGDRLGDRGRQRQRRGGVRGPGGHQQQHHPEGEHHGGVPRRRRRV